jgi:hypothetical protein
VTPSARGNSFGCPDHYDKPALPFNRLTATLHNNRGPILSRFLRKSLPCAKSKGRVLRHWEEKPPPQAFPKAPCDIQPCPQPIPCAIMVEGNGLA